MEYCIVYGCCTRDKTRYEKDNSYFESFGGKGGNQAVALSRAGIKTILLSKFSKTKEEKSITKAHVRNLKKNKVNTKHLCFDYDHKNDYTEILIGKDGDNTLNEVIDISQTFSVDYILNHKQLIENARYVLFQTKTPIDTVKTIIDICKPAGVKTVLTPCRMEKVKANMDVIENVDYITCNAKEVRDIFGKDGSLTESQLNNVLKKYPNKLIVTLGGNGVKFYDGKKIVHEKSIQHINVVDTTGAGDTFCANLVASLVIGDNLRTAVRKGICASTLKIQVEGTQKGMPTAKDRDKLFAKIYKGEYAND